MIRPAALVALLLCPSLAGAETFDPGAVIARMGNMRSGVTLSYDNTRMTPAQAETYAQTDCADFDKKLATVTHKDSQPDTPHMSQLAYSCN